MVVVTLAAELLADGEKRGRFTPAPFAIKVYPTWFINGVRYEGGPLP